MVTSGVPQGSVLGPILFIAYSAEVIGIVEQHGFNAHAFADDLQVYGHAARHEAAVLAERMSACIENVKAWMSSNRLRLNPSKTELIWSNIVAPPWRVYTANFRVYFLVFDLFTFRCFD